jgi:hypothetical protein
MSKRVLQWLPIALGVVFLLSVAYLWRERALKGENDFVAFYAGARLVGTSDLYSRAANQALIQSILGFPLENVTYIRPPFYAALLKPLSLLPYHAAYAVFTLAGLASFLWFVIKFSRECPPLAFLASMSVPLLTAACGGQDTPFLLPILGGSVLLARCKRDFLSGMLLSLCAIKFHLFLFVPLLLLLKKRWGVLGGVTAGTALLTFLGILAGGVDSLRAFVDTLRDPWISASATIMPNIHGLVYAVHGDVWLEGLLIASVAGAFLWTLFKTDNYEILLAVALLCGLLVSFHSGVADDLLLLPVFVTVIGTCTSAPLRIAAALILTPIPYFMVLAGAPYSAIVPLALLLLLGMFCALPWNGRATLQLARQAPSLS